MAGGKEPYEEGICGTSPLEHDVKRAREQTRRNQRTTARAASGCSASRADPAQETDPQETETFDEFAVSFEAALQEDA